MARALFPVLCLGIAACAISAGPSPRAGDTVAAGAPHDSFGTAVQGRADYDWTLQTLEGERVELEAYRGRVVFINMWATWCPPCVAELASIERLRDSLRSTEIVFLLVSPETPKQVADFLKRYRYDLPILLEVDRMPRVFDLRALPTTYVIDRAGNIVARHRGAAEWDRDSVRTFLRSL